MAEVPADEDVLHETHDRVRRAYGGAIGRHRARWSRRR